MPSNDLQVAKAFGETRLRQVARLVALQRQHYEEFSQLGRYMTQRAIFTMVMDCRIAGIERPTIDSALVGDLASLDEYEDLSPPC